MDSRNLRRLSFAKLELGMWPALSGYSQLWNPGILPGERLSVTAAGAASTSWLCGALQSERQRKFIFVESERARLGCKTGSISAKQMCHSSLAHLWQVIALPASDGCSF